MDARDGDDVFSSFNIETIESKIHFQVNNINEYGLIFRLNRLRKKMKYKLFEVRERERARAQKDESRKNLFIAVS